MDIILSGTLASLIAGSVTILGAAVVFLMKKVSDKFLDSAMGFAAGVMLAATFFGLAAPAIKIGGVWRAAIGILAGTAFLIIMEKFIPHMHRIAGRKGPAIKISPLLLFIMAITIHNFPEGLAVGVSFGGQGKEAGTILAIGIGLQNFVEGLAVALALFKDKNDMVKAFLIASFTAIVEPIGGFLGVSVVSLSNFLIPYGLAFAAGAMLFVTSEEVIPETHSRGNAREATIGIILGFVAMMIMETIFS